MKKVNKTKNGENKFHETQYINIALPFTSTSENVRYISIQLLIMPTRIKIIFTK
jgi:hypothetical protein